MARKNTPSLIILIYAENYPELVGKIIFINGFLVPPAETSLLRRHSVLWTLLAVCFPRVFGNHFSNISAIESDFCFIYYCSCCWWNWKFCCIAWIGFSARKFYFFSTLRKFFFSTLFSFVMKYVFPTNLFPRQTDGNRATKREPPNE